MNVIFTCGGTGGHINPAIAVANILKERDPNVNILFIGAQGHREEKLVPQAGYALKTLPGSGLSRSLSLAGLKKNVNAVKCVLSAVSRCKKIIREFQPDVIVGTGGYASFPALYAGSQLKVPTVVHEANAVPGLTTKTIASKAAKVMVSFEESAQYYRHPERVETVGMPVRREFITTNKASARATSPPPRPRPCVRSSPTAAVIPSISSSLPRPPLSAGARRTIWAAPLCSWPPMRPTSSTATSSTLTAASWPTSASSPKT